jgi:trigger factor
LKEGIVSVTREITNLDNSAVRLTFTYKNEDLRAKYNEIVNNFAKEAHLKGFRKGKAPVSVLESKMGKALKEEALNTIIGKTVDDALKSEDFPEEALPLAYSPPEVEGEPVLDLSSDLVFSVKYDAAPVANITKWEGFEVEVNTAEVTEADVDLRLQEIREQNAIVIEKDDDDAAEKGDVVTVDYSELDESGGEISDTTREDFTFTLGSGHSVFKFDDELVGMKKGETRDIENTYPDDFEDTDLAGKTKKIRVTLTEVKQKSFPDDDELAQDYDEKFETIDDLRADIKESLETALTETLRKLKFKKIMEKIIESNPISIPESMIEQESYLRIRRMFGDNISEESAYKMAETLTDEKTREENSVNIKTFMITVQLMKDLNIEALPEDRELFYADMAEAKGKPFDEVKEDYINSMGGEDYLNKGIKQKKFTDILLEKNTVKTGKKVNLLDIITGIS